MIYLDNAATTRMDDEVFGEMLPYLKEQYGNPGSIHSCGLDAKSAVKKARERVARLIGAEPEQIIFTSGGSEANNLAIKGSANYIRNELNKNLVISDKIEHSSLLKSINNVCIKHGFQSRLVNVTSDGVVNIEELEAYIKSGAAGIVSIMHTNNELGSVNDVERIGRLCKEYDVLFHTDCVQAVGFSDLNVDKIQCDFMSISSHKIHGGKGMGCLYARNPEILEPLIHGGNSQEFGMRGGTENVPGIVAFGKACQIAKRNMVRNRNIISRVSKYAKDALRGSGIEFAFNSDNGYNKVINIRLKGVDAETLILFLSSSRWDVMISAGSACDSREHKPSHVLTAIGLSEEEARESIRISLSKDNSSHDIDMLISGIKEFIEFI